MKLIVVVVGIILLLLLSGCEDVEFIESVCSDTDGGKDYYNKGRVTDIEGATSPYDYCIEGQLKEYFCELTGYAGSEIVDCLSDYECEGGECVEVIPCSDSDDAEILCSDSDGADYFNRGCIIYEGDAYWDACAGDWLTEFICVGDSGDSIQYECPYGCEDGACREG